MPGSRSQTYVLGLHMVVGVLVIVAATVLAALHDLDAQAAVAIYGAAIGLAGGSAGSLAMLGTTINGKSVVTQETMSAMAANLERTVSYLAGARHEVDAMTVPGGRRANDPPAEPAHPAAS